MPLPRHDLADLVRQHQQRARGGDGPLHEVTDFGANPGNLRLLSLIPADLPPGAPLVVALHGCTQTAAGYAAGSGWGTLAARHRFALLLPEQREANNPNRCFNWFEPADTARGRGEVASIHAMVEWAIATHRLDRRRVFVTGLSAGGAMANAMLAAYPEVFAAGAILAGLPYGCATDMPGAFEAMATGRPRPGRAWGDLVRAASPHRGPWPRVAIWQGDADTTVRPANAEQLTRQWAELHGIEGPALRLPAAPGERHVGWRDAEGRLVLSLHMVEGMAHGVPLDAASGTGRPGPFFLETGIDATGEIAGFFGIAPAPARTARPAAARAEPESGPGAVIRRALAAAGLLPGGGAAQDGRA